MKKGKFPGMYACMLTVLLFCLGISLTVSAAEGICGKRMNYGKIVWRLNDNGVLTIEPDDTNDLTSRAGMVENCTWDKSLVREVILKPGIYAIGKDVFYGHKNLQKVTLPEGLLRMGGSVFYGCSNLTEIAAPAGFVLKDFGSFIDDDNIWGAFEECRSLRSVPVLSDSSINDRSFFGCANLDHVVIAEGVTGIGDAAFSDCRSLSDLTIPATVKTIGKNAFFGCGLKSVAIPDGVTTIPFYGFSNNQSLKTVTIPDSVTRIETAAFKDCALTEVKLSKNVSYIGGSDYGDIDDFAFDKTVVIDAPAGSYAANWAKEKGFTLKGETKKNDNAGSSDNKTKKKVQTAAGTFSVSGKQATFTAPANKKAASLSIPSKINGVKVTAIAPGACAKMTKLKKVTIPSTVKTIGKKAFYGCRKLKEIIIKTTKLKKNTVGAKALSGIYKKALIKCPKSKKAFYKKILLKKGLKKSVRFK